ncbi:uncharacterized protein LOC103151150 [Poecilia formosa]|uniref:uncharacterized protein LOC103151150 n=1 Tax=Poecilia formosa TaxID=48698 RepID=UPI0004446F56|nr:PREDICTED: uncharacterized protein LOC103151150 [Poecilia formosa]
MMVSRVLLLLQLLLLTSVISALQHWGGTMNVVYRGRNPDGSFKLSVRTRATYDTCDYSHYWYCYSGNCSSPTSRQLSQIDSSTDGPSDENQWCEAENIESWSFPSDKPVKFRAASCCWTSTRNSVSNWRLNTLVDLGMRSDTRKPNKSPNIAILPFIRVPQNCPRTYNLPSFDADGDHVRCRYGNVPNIECDNCNSISGFQLDQDSCRLSYQSTNADHRVFGFEMVVEDFPRRSIDLLYSDGSKAHKFPLIKRMKRKVEVVLVGHPLTTGAPETKQGTADPERSTSWRWRSTPATTESSVTLKTTDPFWSWRTTTSTAPTISKTPSAAPTVRTSHPAITKTSSPTSMTKSSTTSTTPAATTTPWREWWTTTMSSGLQSTTHQKGNISPISELPLQFAFLVDPPVPSCQDGLYLPRFVAPTPSDGERMVGEVEKELEVRVMAQATQSAISNLILSGPTNVTKHRDTKTEFIIRWTPTEDDLGGFYPICFAVESVNGRSVYQSEMRCVLVEIRKRQIEATVTCTESTMKVEVDKASLFGLQEDQKHLVEARFYCQYPKRGNVTLSFSAHRKNVTVWEKGFGTFTYQFEFYQNDQFEAKYDPNSYPLEFDIGNRIYMQLDASSSVNNTEMFVESCRASPYDNPNYHPTYSIIENGCKVDPTLQINSTSNNRQFRFSMEAFKFIGLHDQVYISCTVMMCEAGNPNTRCSRGCSNSTMHNFRNKREAVIESGKHFVSQGPLRLKREADPRGGSAVNLNLNLVFVAGCLLAAVGMVCGVIIYKTKTSRVKYQPLPAYES